MTYNQQRAASPAWSISTNGLPLLLFVSIAFFMVADVGAISSKDGFLFILAIAVFVPVMRPFLLMLISSIQDARGFAYMWSYVSFAAVGTLMITDYMWKSGYKRFRRLSAISENRDFGFIVVLGTLVISFGFAVSLANALLDGYPQSSEKPFFIIGFLKLLMIIAAYVTINLLRSQKNGVRNATVVIAMCLGHILLISLLQIAVKPELFRSPEMAGKVMEEGQMVIPAAFGLPRINGTYVNANAFGLGPALLLLTLVGCLGKNSNRLLFVMCHIFIGFYVTILALSKAIAAYFVTTAIILMWRLRSRYKKPIIALVVLLGILGLRFLIVEHWDMVTMAFRYKGDDIGTRGLAWGMMLREFSIVDWLVGTGLSYWPVFFYQKLGLEINDPHSVLLSVPGTYGLMGVMFYVVLVAAFIKILISRTSPEQAKLLMLMIGAMLLGKDLVSIPHLFGNTPLTYLLWLSIGFGFCFEKGGRTISENRYSRGILKRGDLV